MSLETIRMDIVGCEPSWLLTCIYDVLFVWLLPSECALRSLVENDEGNN